MTQFVHYTLETIHLEYLNRFGTNMSLDEVDAFVTCFMRTRLKKVLTR